MPDAIDIDKNAPSSGSFGEIDGLVCNDRAKVVDGIASGGARSRQEAGGGRGERKEALFTSIPYHLLLRS